MADHLVVSPLSTGGLEMRIKARQIGDCLYATEQGSVFIKMSDAHIRDVFSTLLSEATAKQEKGMYPFAESYRLKTLSGTFVLDAALTEEIASELTVYIVESDIGPELLARYAPE